MNYFLMSRLIYSMPFLLYMILAGQQYLSAASDGFLYAGAWVSIFLFSLFFFAMARKELPRPLVHFVFLAECFIYSELADIGHSPEILLFIVLSSFYAIDSLRNSLFSIGLHLAMLFGMFYAVDVLDTIANMMMNKESMAIIASPLICRALMSIVDERDVEVREEYKNNDVFVAVEDTSTIDKLRRKVNVFRLRNMALQDQMKHSDREKARMAEKAKRAQKEAEQAEKKDFSRQEMNQEIARMYFSLLANIRFDLTQRVEENLDRMIATFRQVTKAQYAALIVKEPPTKTGESYSLALTNSCNAPGFQLRDEQVIESQDVWDMIIDAIENCKLQSVPELGEGLKPLSSMLITPVCAGNDVKGVLIQGFDSERQQNVHDCNMSLMVAYHLYSVLKNEAVYRQAADGSSLDPLTGLLNRKYLLSSLEVTFNNAYNYSSSLAIVVAAFDRRQDDRGILFGADVLKRHIRKSDVLYRYSENSFVVVFNGVSMVKIERFADEINEELASAPVTTSMSMGAKVYDPLIGNAHTGQDLLDAAGKGLIQARKRGQGQFCLVRD